MQLLRFLFPAASIGIGLCTLAVMDNALRVPWHIVPQPDAANALAQRTDSQWQEIQVTAKDGAVLDGWLFNPPQPNGSVVIALHGVADTRLGMLAHAEFLLRNGFTVLVPDSRGHGKSGGGLITYGVREAEDIRRWSDRLLQNPALHRLYGIGQSMGSAILLESLKVEPRFRAVVADCPFATFEEVSYDRLQQVTRMPTPAFWPIIRLGFFYTNLRYGVDLRQASPADAIRTTHTPILLIHGNADTNIPPRHSQELHAMNPAATALWMVPGAGHVASLSTDPQAYARRVVAWFDSHP